ncbi:arabinogalactan oligomer/maltooligosaccharide transport system substrate-binding protein [Gracilibacillus halotolerans]|uniref:Maltodextrin-binding protein n=1 Tax=Gracilibacillus halotolerans TaxID=74386 RepID=A0A841RT00_9BACI|nr:arabinogalactan oligomer/maltooligosaccharide transport system substrate-binding protein [Gracilibacillus halotolerans]
MKKYKTLLVLILASLLLVLAACAPDREGTEETNNDSDSTSDTTESNETEGETGEMPEKPESLVVWINDEDIAEDVQVDLFDRYTEETGIEIEFRRVPMPDQIQELSLAGPTGDGPDLYFQPQDRLGDVIAQGLAIPIDYTDEEKSGFNDVALDAFTYDGEIYGAPVAIETYFAYYNKSLVDTVPETIEDVFAMSEEITDASQDQYGFLVSPEFYYLYSFMNAYGGYVFGEENGVYDPTDVGLANEGAIEGLTKYKEFLDAGLMPKTLTVDIMDGLFKEGKVGMVISGPWNMPLYKEALGDNVATAPLPKMNGEIAPSFVGVKSWLVSYYSDHPEWAADLAKFMTNDENSQHYYDVTGELAPRPEILDSVTDEMYAGYTEQVPHGTLMPNIPEMAAVWDMDVAIELINNGSDVDSALNDTVQSIKDKIEATGQ